MTYAEAVDHLYSLGPELAVAQSGVMPGGPAPRKFDLAHMRVLCAALGYNTQSKPAVLIAGTNGKGSTAATLASILSAAGYRTGLYTSPHLVHVTERMQLSRSGVLEPIPEDDFAQLYTRVDAACQGLLADGSLAQLPSFFERLTAVAFLYFDREQADIMVLEVGLGGRLDATNVVEPLLSVITDIALDHQEYLGNTIAEIAREKCGILRRHGTLITLSQHPEANQAIGEAATALDVRAINAAVYLPPAMRNNELPEGVDSNLPRNRYVLNLEDGLLQVDSPLPGAHQQRNVALAIAAAVELRNYLSYNITNAAMEEGIRGTSWPGRLELIAPDLLLDVAHNPAGAWTLRAAIAALPPAQPRTLIFSCLRDKSLTEMSRILFPLFDSSTDGDPLRRQDHIVLAPIANPRAASVEDLLAAAHALQIPVHAAPHLAAAFAQARRITPVGGIIIATGSVYLVGEIRQLALEAIPFEVMPVTA
jgi:dihydrofolate synthase/folylpolyglutamate synthase